MSRMPKNLDSNGRRRMVAIRTPDVSRADIPRASARFPVRVAAPARRPRPSSEELFGREPFTSGREPRYYGTGVPFYQSGPGFTGGYYGYGDEPPEIPTELEREYAYDLYGDRNDPPASPPIPRFSPIQAAPAFHSVPRKARKYPPGPKGYQRSDERMREEICDELMQTDHIDSSEVTVEVTSGKVTLDGSVPERWMKHAIEDLAAACRACRKWTLGFESRRPRKARDPGTPRASRRGDRASGRPDSHRLFSSIQRIARCGISSARVGRRR